MRRDESMGAKPNGTATPQMATGYFSSVRKDIEKILPERLGSVLEIGCASGATMAWLRSIRPVEFARGIEIVPEIAAEAQSAFDEVIVGNIESLALADDRLFDAVIALDVVEHLVDPWAALRSLRALLRPDGVVLASIPNVSHWQVSCALFFGGRWDYQQEGLLDKTHLRFFTEDTVNALFVDAGYAVEKVDYVKVYPHILRLFGNDAKWRWYSRKLLEPILPARFANFQFLIRARKLG
jgi:SAM-dependent methyltransferase